MERLWDIPNMDAEPGKSKWLASGNPEEMPHISDLNCYKGATLSESPHVSIHIYYTFFLS